MNILKTLVLLVLTISCLLSAANAAHFVIHSSGSNQDFVIELNDAAKIAHARDLISGATTSEKSINGIIVKSTASYNPNWSFHYDPSTITFFDFAMEVCDASTEYVEEHLDEACSDFLPNCRWCPWGSVVVSEITN